MDTKTLHQTKTQHTNIMSTDQTYQDQIFKDLPPTSVLHLFDPSYDYETYQQPIQTTDPNDTVATLHIPQTQDSGQKFTQKQIRNSPDYDTWCQSQFQQRDMYDEQGMFGTPEP